MWFSVIKSERGGVYVLVLSVVPLLVVSLAFVINIGQFMFARARLQATVDRAAYAGAASMADSLNNMAAQNWRVFKAWRDLEYDFESDSQRDRDTAERRYNRYENDRDIALEGMKRAAQDMCGRSELAAARTLELNDSSVEAEVVVLGCDQWPGNSIDEVEEGRVDYSYITGRSFIDPDDVEHGNFAALKYISRKRVPTIIGVIGHQRVRPLLLNNVFGEENLVQAISAAQAYGGSIEQFARKETDTVEEAGRVVADDGQDDLYRMSFIPVNSLIGAMETW